MASNKVAGDVRLTTVDNPYDPFTQWNDWYRWDDQAGYHTSSLLGRLVVDSFELSDADQAKAVEEAIDEIISENVSGMHRKVFRDGVVEES